MTARRWRGTLIYSGTVAALGAAAFSRFGGLPGEPATPSANADASTASSAPSTAAPGPVSGESDATRPTIPGPADTASGSATGAVTVTGSVAQTRYGPVQVAVTFDAGHITAVQTLQSPTGHHESDQISAYATPLLEQEVLTAQSAQVDTVSGATYTSEGYRESVQAAIDQAG